MAYTVRDAIAHADLPDASATITVRTTNFMTIKKIAFNYVLQGDRKCQPHGWRSGRS
eukprot:COSAG06_NODE_3873_length_4814_cov_3.323648_5_plen_57_part_00